ncbi:phage shock protein operon transcriptional activator [Roseiterribacter gracilis]|uniref:PSP operon transcriptional activator n=1 Tax=Roseiterribacter gracilis TaxID=2812848 RepID=A0A8S8XGU4_9PROT|nr:PSP operon transcriptional activator [Rhodospirillales bacterium TMPK1]
MLDALVGESPLFTEILNDVSALAKLDRPVLVVGERGTGKELIAQRLHYLSRRWDQTLIKLNCATLSESLLDSELFGHEAGAFTGATKRREGRFERADGGTLFLDEIATASMAVQEKLLRVIEYGEFERLGASETVASDVRVVAATNVDLPALAAQGKFRADLLDRLAFAVVTVPPLRVRPEDILALSRHFGTQMAQQMKREVFSGFSKSAEAQLLDYRWPGNVRELKNVVERAVASAVDPDKPIDQVRFDPFESPWRPGAELHAGALAATAQAAADDPAGAYDFAQHVAQTEKRLLLKALQQNQHQQKRTATFLGLEYHQLRNLLRKYGIIGPESATRAAPGAPQ